MVGDRSNQLSSWIWLSWARARPIADAVTLLQKIEENHQVITSFKQAMTRMNKNCTWIPHDTCPFKKPQVSVLYLPLTFLMSAFQARHSSAVLPLEPTTSPADFAAARELFEILDKETWLAKISQSCLLHALKSFWRWTSWTSSQNMIETRMQKRGLILFDCLLLPCTSGGESSKADLATFVVEIGITLDTKTFRLCT